MPNYYIDWLISTSTGWGLLGFHLVKESLKAGDVLISICPTSHEFTHFSPFDKPIVDKIEQVRGRFNHFRNVATLVDPNGVRFFQLAHNNLVGEDSLPDRVDIQKAKEIGLIFLEHDGFSDEKFDWLVNRFDGLVVGSQWNYDLLLRRDFPRHKLHLIYQGYDQAIFFPHLPSRLNDDGRFYIYSGGQIGDRKAQDVVIKAFAKFVKDVPQAVLVSQWHFFKEDTFIHHLFGRAIFEVEPQFNEEGKLDWQKTVGQHGIAPDQFIDLVMANNHDIATIMRKCHAAVFPNRSEGGTNQIAVEAIACGLPVILANGTGQSDLIHLMPKLAKLSLNNRLSYNFHLTDDFPRKEEFQSYQKLWFWSDPQELYQKMLELYRNYQEHADNAVLLAEEIKQFSWQKYYQQLKAVAEKLA